MRPRGAVRMASLTYTGDEDRSAQSAEIGRLSAVEQRRLAAVIANTMFRLAGMDGDPDAAEAVEWLTHPDGPRFSLSVETNMFMAHTAEKAGRYTLKARAWRVLATAAHPDPHLAALEAIWGVRERIAPEALLRYDAVVREQIEQVAGRGGDAPETNNGASVLH